MFVFLHLCYNHVSVAHNQHTDNEMKTESNLNLGDDKDKQTINDYFQSTVATTVNEN